MTCRHVFRPGASTLLLLVGVASYADDARPASSPRSQVSISGEREIQLALRSKSALPRVKLLEKLRRAGPAAGSNDVIDALADGLRGRIAREAFDAVDLELLAWLASLQEAAPEVELFLSEKSTPIKLIALRGLIDAGHLPAWERIESLTKSDDDDKSYALRRSVVEVAERDASHSAIEFLIDTVAAADGQLKYEAAIALTRLTNQPYGGRAEDWQTWWHSAREEFAATPDDERKSVSLAEPIAWPKPVPEFFKIPIYAGKVLFIIDRSKSMASSISGELRIERAADELEGAIQGLPATAEFNIIAFHDLVEPWSPQLMPATKPNQRDAILFAHRLQPELKTACYDALAQGLDQHGELEAIYFLSDGEPTSGAIVSPPAIVEAITLQNRLKFVSIYTLGIDARGVHREFLKNLAARNHGEFFLIR